VSKVDSQNRDQNEGEFSSDVKIIPQNEFVGMPCSAEDCFTVDECRQIVRLGEAQEDQDATVNQDYTIDEPGISEDSIVLESVRKSRVTWLYRELRSKWIFDRIDDVVREVNQTYRFDLSGYNLIQIARYSEGNYYDWHLDIGKKSSSTRKLSITVQLSDPADYDGGELELFSFTRKKPTRNIGSIIVFPSFLTHRVAPVTRGVRWSLVAWVNGPPFR
jgi:PKHD-type hydroxylase